MTAIPAARAAAGPCRAISCPSTCSDPASGWYTPARIFTSVDLPAPFSPTRACASPAYSSIDPSVSACTAPNALAACRSTSTGACDRPSAAPDAAGPSGRVPGDRDAAGRSGRVPGDRDAAGPSGRVPGDRDAAGRSGRVPAEPDDAGPSGRWLPPVTSAPSISLAPLVTPSGSDERPEPPVSRRQNALK